MDLAFCKRMPSRVWPTCVTVCRTRSCCLKVPAVPGCGPRPTASWSRSPTTTAISAAPANRQPGSAITHDRVNGGGWSRPASDISLLGSDTTGTYFPGYYINRTNGVSFAGGTWQNTGGKDYISGGGTAASQRRDWHGYRRTLPNPRSRRATSCRLHGPARDCSTSSTRIDPVGGHDGGQRNGPTVLVPSGWSPRGAGRWLGEIHLREYPNPLFARLVTRDQDEPVDGSYYESYQAH